MPLSQWLELFGKYGGWQLLAIAIAGFLYRELWPWLKKRADDRETERKEREAANRAELQQLTEVMRSTVDVHRKMVERLESVEDKVDRGNGLIVEQSAKIEKIGEAMEKIRIIFTRRQGHKE